MMKEATGNAPAIRAAQAGDHAAIARLLHQLGYAASPDEVRARLQALSASAIDRVLVADLHGDVVGCISLHALPLFHASGQMGRITSLVVDERHRSLGIGEALLDAAAAWFASAGCVKLEVTSSDHRDGAHRFYERHGYRRDGQRFTRKIR